MPDTDLASEVPTLTLEPTNQAPAQARSFLAEVFHQWAIKDDHAGQVIVSELVTNAVLHGAGLITVRVLRQGAGDPPTIEVSDQGQGKPCVRHPTWDEGSGRGILTVERLSRAWGTRRISGGGKVVWAALAVETGSTGSPC
jgi:anti-sigma regulatory factor (Ser/Thr protein kinase)